MSGTGGVSMALGTALADFARALIDARCTGVAVPADHPATRGMTEADAYAVQARVAEALGPVGGFKVACKPGQPQIMAPILARDTHNSPARLACPAEEQIGIELEIGFRVLSELPPPDAPDRDARLAGCLALVPAIEIVRTRLSGTPSPLAKLADNQVNGALVVGPETRDWYGRDLSGASGHLRAGDTVLLEGRGEVPGGDAFANFKALEAMLGTRFGGLVPGQVVITGSLSGLSYIAPGCEIRGALDGWGKVALDLDREEARRSPRP
ncbi:2-keto-4-pentenoate hydratase [Rhodovulum iodosum]|uniref:2-keto-4-pentenoate hydratase n=1 Tax=Rhodovulum iodosum TaxID=68291 RepID=A0ABV3XTS3_9RHOB|nr:2-keto-4-pentenoate hydratase [Rhodovulum robiginosum]RSK32183.1 2-keto-4-pentenoate hydratase [Rhodovulum robiginosum]